MSAPASSAPALGVVSSDLLPAPLDDDARHQLVEQAYRRYLAPLGQYAEQLAAQYDADALLAHDAVHDVFTALLAGRRDDVFSRDETGLRKHLFSAVKHRFSTLCRDERSRSRRDQEASRDRDDRDDPAVVALGAAADRELTARRAVLHAALAACPPRAVEAFHLVRAGELSYEAAAARMGVAPTTVRVQVSLVMRRLRELMQNDSGLSSEPGDVT